MDIAIIGATGKVGQRLVSEARRRDHKVIGISRTCPAELPDIPLLRLDANDSKLLAEAICGRDAVILAGRFVSIRAAAIIRGVKIAEVPRLLVVGGAGTLFVSPGVRLIDTGIIPEAFMPEVSGGSAFLAELRRSDIDWTFLSPAAKFAPGQRTGRFRLGGDDMLHDADGNSCISYEDFAVAMIDELENPQHTKARFSVAY